MKRDMELLRKILFFLEARPILKAETDLGYRRLRTRHREVSPAATRTSRLDRFRAGKFKDRSHHQGPRYRPELERSRFS